MLVTITRLLADVRRWRRWRSSALIYGLLYAFFAFLVARWSRGILPVAAALSMILAIFCAVGADSWFARDKSGFDEAPDPRPR